MAANVGPSAGVATGGSLSTGESLEATGCVTAGSVDPAIVSAVIGVLTDALPLSSSPEHAVNASAPTTRVARTFRMRSL
jgi:hypothetical protein